MRRQHHPRAGLLIDRTGLSFQRQQEAAAQLSQSQRETLGPFGVEVATLQVSGALTRDGRGTEAAHLFQQQLADVILAIDAPPLTKIDGHTYLPTMLQHRPKLVT
jgi:hypothetical protein